MKNIKEILKGNGLELSEEVIDKIMNEVKENYKTINDYENQRNKLELAEKNAKEIQGAFDTFKKGFEGVNVDELKQKVGTLEENLTTVKSEYEGKLGRMTLETTLKDLAKEHNCVDFDLAKTQFNYDELLNSKNQLEDAKNIFTKLKETKPILFKVEEQVQQPTKVGKVIGALGDEPKASTPFKSFI